MNTLSKKYLEKLESLRQVFIGLKMLHSSTLPETSYIITNQYFSFMGSETIKLILGRLCILLFDETKNKKHNTISFKLLLNEILENEEFKDNKKLKNLLHEIKEINKRYKIYRDKYFAHIELDKNDSLRQIDDLHISNKDITDLLHLAQKTYDYLFYLLLRGGDNHMETEIKEYSEKLWKCYETAGLVKKCKE